MNSHLNKEIFSETGCINKDVLLNYRDGKLRDAEKHEVEKHLVDCHLCCEALEGFVFLTGTNSFYEINERLDTLTTGSANVNYTRYFAVAASVAAVVVLSYFVFKQFDDVKVERLAAGETLMEDTVIPESTLEVVQPDVVVAEPEEIVQPLEIPAPVSTHAATETVSERSMDETADLNKTAEVAAAESITLQDEVPVAAAPKPLSKGSNEEVVTFSNNDIKATTGYISNITYVDNRKVIDYSDANKDMQQRTVEPAKSTSSKYENRQKKEAAENEAVQAGIESKRKVEYLQLLAIPISLYNDGRYDAAVKGFDELLLINPNDENARFYKGMSLYHLKRYDNAITLLKPLSAGNTQPFSEEALFYVGKSYAAKGENNQAVTIFRSIVSGGGFYAERAKGELKNLQ